MTHIRSLRLLAAVLALAASCAQPSLQVEQDVLSRSAAPGLASNLPSLYIRGTFNGWGSQAMALVADHVWEAKVTFGWGAGQKFKFDTHADWSRNWGDNNLDGYGDANGADIGVTEGRTYFISFDDRNNSYKVQREIHTDIFCLPGNGAQWIELSGLPVDILDETGSRVRTTEIHYTTTDPMYAPLRNPGMRPGTYTAKVDTITGTSPNRVRWYGETTFTLVDSASPSPTLKVFYESAEPELVMFDIFAAPGPGLVNTQETAGMLIRVRSDDGSIVRGQFITSGTGGVSASFRNPGLPEGRYTAELHEGPNTDGYAYDGTLSFVLDADQPRNFDLSIAKVWKGGKVSVTYSLMSSFPWEDQDLLGLEVVLTKDGETVATKELTGAGYYNQPYTSFGTLEEGHYTLTLDAVKDGFRYYAVSDLSVAPGRSYSSTTARVQKTANYRKNFDQLYFRGTINGWGTTEMTLVADNTWEIVAAFGNLPGQRFKVDVLGDWSHNYGDNNGDLVGDRNGADIYVTPTKTYRIQFNDVTLRFTVTEL